MKRRDYDDTVGARAGSGIGDTTGTLFGVKPVAEVAPQKVPEIATATEVSPQKVHVAETYTPAERKRDIQRLVPLAQELAEKAGPAGITVSNLRFAAVRKNLLTGAETGRRLSFLGAVMKRAGLVNTGQFRRSDVMAAHGNLNAVHVLRKYARAG